MGLGVEQALVEEELSGLEGLTASEQAEVRAFQSRADSAFLGVVASIPITAAKCLGGMIGVGTGDAGFQGCASAVLDPVFDEWQRRADEAGGTEKEAVSAAVISTLLPAAITGTEAVQGFGIFGENIDSATHAGRFAGELLVTAAAFDLGLEGEASASSAAVEQRLSLNLETSLTWRDYLPEARARVAAAKEAYGPANAVAMADEISGGRISGVPDSGFQPNPGINAPYARPSGFGPTAAQKRAVQGLPCVDCGTIAPKQVADHVVPGVVEYFRTGRNDVAHQSSIEAVQAHCPTCSRKQGGFLSAFSRRMKELLGIK
jgi:hypothetical protein